VDFGVIDRRHQIFYMRQILAKKWKCSGTVHQLFIELKKPAIQLGGKYCTIFSVSLVYPGN
jgi:hypothetical protein